MIPQVTISGTITSVETPKEGVTKINVTVQNKDESMVYSVTFFKERAAKFAQPGIAGREIVVVCNLKSREYQGKFYLDLLGTEYGFRGGAPAQPAYIPPPPQTSDEDSAPPF